MNRQRVLLAVAAAVTTLAAVTVVAIAVSRGGGQAASPPTTTTPAPPSTTGTTTTGTSTGTSTSAARPFGYVPLWPFSGTEDAAAWQASYREGGHAPWHLDADATALAFTTGYLGFTEIDRVLTHTVGDTEAHVTVGFPIAEHTPGTAAVLHLVRIGTGADAPWEVVGTADTTLTLTQPRYGATVSPPVTVGGRITGVDESIRVEVLAPAGRAGESCCVAAGGDDTPWTATVDFPRTPGAALTIVASTGGHVTEIERFAITGVRTAS